jgi:hypothetical protein
VTRVTGAFTAFGHGGRIEGEAVGLAANLGGPAMLTRMTRFLRAPEFALALSFLGVLAVYVAAASASAFV